MVDQMPYQPEHPVQPPNSGQPTGNPIRAALAAYVSLHSLGTPAAELLTLAASGGLTRPVAVALAEQLAQHERQALKAELLDALLFAIATALSDARLTREEISELQQLRRTMGIHEGDLYRHRRARLGAILDAEMRRLLADRKIDPTEALHQVDLQEVFDLSYDEYLELTKPVADRIVNELIESIATDGVVTSEEREQLDSQLRALDSVYKLNSVQRQRLQKAGLNLPVG